MIPLKPMMAFVSTGEVMYLFRIRGITELDWHFTKCQLVSF